MRKSMVAMLAILAMVVSGHSIWTTAELAAQPGGGKKGRGAGEPGAALTNAQADQLFERLDKNGDGKLNQDEMPRELMANLARFDKNGDGLIDQKEFREFFLARLAGDVDSSGAQPGGAGAPGDKGQPGAGKKGAMGPGGGQPGGFGGAIPGGGGFGGAIPGGFGGGQPGGGFGPMMPAAVKPTTWQYRVLTRESLAELGKDNLEVGLNQVGAEGWELIGIEAGVRRALNSYLFRRPGTAKPHADAKPSVPPVSTEKADAKVEFRAYRMKHANALEVARMLDELMRTGRADSLRVVADPRTNSLLVKGPAQVHLDVGAVLELLDVPGDADAPRPGQGKNKSPSPFKKGVNGKEP